MLAIAILFASTFLQETSDSIGKKAMKKRVETVYSLVFLGTFWTVVFLIIAVNLGAKFQFSMASLPTFIPRLILEGILLYIGAKAVASADRSTLGFVRLVTIPLLLATDLVLGYHLSTWQFVGIGLMFLGLFLAFHHNPRGKKGAGLALLWAIISVATASLYKWDITHFNSVTGEQISLFSILLVFFFVQSFRYSKTSPLKLLFGTKTGTQSLAGGLSFAIESFAFGFAPASVVISLKRTLALMWSIFFGRTYFHEKKMGQKVYSGAVLLTGLVLLITPYIK